MGRPQGKEETGVGGSPYFPGSRRGKTRKAVGGQGDLRRSRGQGCSKGHQDRELGDPEKVLEAEESESLAGAMGKKPRRITARSWVGAGQAGRLKEGTRPQGDHWLPSLPEASHPLYTSPHRHSTSQSHPPHIHLQHPRHTRHPSGPVVPLSSLLSGLPCPQPGAKHGSVLWSLCPPYSPVSLSTARSQARVQSLTPLFRETPPRGDTSMSPERSWAQERGQGTLTSLWKTKVTHPAK